MDELTSDDSDVIPLYARRTPANPFPTRSEWARFEREAPYYPAIDCFVTKDGRRFNGFRDWKAANG